MQHVSLKNGAVIVKLNRQFYSREALDKAAKEFCNACNSKTTKQGNFFQVILLPRSKGLYRKETGLAFCNFALAAMQTR